MSEKIIRIKSGNEEITMNVTEEEYRNYFRPWWQMKKREQRNREAMEQNGYTEESYEAWRDNASEGAGRSLPFPPLELPDEENHEMGMRLNGCNDLDCLQWASNRGRMGRICPRNGGDDAGRLSGIGRTCFVR